MRTKKIQKIEVMQFSLAIGILLLHNGLPAPEYSNSLLVALQRNFNNLLEGCVSFFFLISGYLFAVSFKGDYFKYILKRVKTLIIPYFCWSMIYYVLINYLSRKTEEIAPICENPIIFMAHGTTGGLWFLRYLFLLQICGLILWKAMSKNKWVAIILLAGATAIGIIIQSSIPVIPTYYLPVYLFGTFVGLFYKDSFTNGKWNRSTKVLAPVILIIGIIALYFCEPIGLLVYRYVMPMCVWILVDALILSWKVKKWMTNSFLLYVVHIDIYTLLRLFESKIVSGVILNYIFLIINPFIAFGIVLILSILINRVLPLKILLTGGR